MSKNCYFIVLFAALVASQSPGAWIFGGGEASSPASTKRLSQLIEPVSRLIDLASDTAETGTVAQAVSVYKQALAEIDRIERENPERAKSSELATIRTKRAYIENSINSLKFKQASTNAKPVAVSDTTELERRLAEQKDRDREKKLPSRERARLQTVRYMASGDLDKASRLAEALYERNTNDVMALNLLAAVQAAQRKFDLSEAHLARAITLAPDDYVAYYNMARLLMQRKPADKEVARGFFADGCALGGPRDSALEELLK